MLVTHEARRVCRELSRVWPQRQTPEKQVNAWQGTEE